MSLDKHVELMTIKKCHMILIALILSIQYDWANGASRTRGWQPNFVNSPSLPPYNDVIGGDHSTPVSDVRSPPPPPYCVYPPPARPNLPAPASPNAFPPAGPPSIAPVSGSPPTNAPPGQGVWCVANPTVASVDVQAAMDYACGSGADCGMAAPGGPCYLPDTLMAHASYSFNSYWQRTKAAGAAMLITKDPSYDDCRYVYM